MKIATGVITIIFIISSSFITLCHGQGSVFFGMTLQGGIYGAGTIIRLEPANTETVVWNFGSGNDGAHPYGNLVYDTINGLFYGTTNAGGYYKDGVIFSFDPVNDSENVVWNFGNDTDGANPVGDLTYNPGNRLFYGMTEHGGNGTLSGTIFSFNPDSNTEHVLWNFGSGTDGYWPSGDLVYDAGLGLFYGMTAFGGSADISDGGYGAGVIFSFDPDRNTEYVVWNFGADTDGIGPYGNLVYDTVNGLFYGMTSSGGSEDANAGSIFSFDPVNDSEHVVWSFKRGTDGAQPLGSVAYDAVDRVFYGMTSAGGSNGQGAIITFNPATDKESVVWSFKGPPVDGGYPNGDLEFDASNGSFYGMTMVGGNVDSDGVIFSFNPAANSEQILWDFKGIPDGAHPLADLVPYTGPIASGITDPGKAALTINIFPNPTTGSFTITVLTIGQTIQVYNYLGQKITGSSVENSTQQIDISSQPNGVYLIQVLSKDGVTVSEQRVVKTN